MIRWHNLFLFSERRALIDDIADRLRYTLTREGWEQYDPFGLIPGRTYARTLKLFLSPDDETSWRRILVEASQVGDVRPVGEALSTFGSCLELALDTGHASFMAYRGGAGADFAEVIGPWLNAEAWQALCDSPPVLPVLGDAEAVGAVPLSALPPDVQRMAEQLSAQQSAPLFDKMASKLLPPHQQASGRALLASQAPDWDSAGGRQIRALAEALGFPSAWREPDFTTVRIAYQLMMRQKRNPHAKLLPGDEGYLQAVPSALSYVPIYGGKDA